MRRVLRRGLVLIIVHAITLAVVMTGPSACVGDLMCSNTCASGQEACRFYSTSICPTDRGCRVDDLCQCADASCDSTTSYACEVKRDQPSCVAEQGCVWQATCDGRITTPANCEDLDEDDCKQRPGCRYERHCN